MGISDNPESLRGEEPAGASPVDPNPEPATFPPDALWRILAIVLIAVLLFGIYRIAERWAHRREEAAAEARRRRLREARERHAASLEEEMNAFKATPAYAELERASAAATGGIRPEHRGQLSRHGPTPRALSKPWRPNPADRYGKTRRGGGGG